MRSVLLLLCSASVVRRTTVTVDASTDVEVTSNALASGIRVSEPRNGNCLPGPISTPEIVDFHSATIQCGQTANCEGVYEATNGKFRLRECGATQKRKRWCNGRGHASEKCNESQGGRTWWVTKTAEPTQPSFGRCMDTDADDRCAYRAKYGECSTNREYMSEHCRRTCNLCGSTGGTCTDTPGWLSGQQNSRHPKRTCDVYAKNWCANGEFKPGLEWTGKAGVQHPNCRKWGSNDCGALYNYPADNCCACGKKGDHDHDGPGGHTAAHDIALDYLSREVKALRSDVAELQSEVRDLEDDKGAGKPSGWGW